MPLFEVEIASLGRYANLWMGRGLIWRRDFYRVLAAMSGASATAFELKDDRNIAAVGWVAPDRFEAELLAAPAVRAVVLTARPMEPREVEELAAWLEVNLAGAVFACVQTWKPEGLALKDVLAGFRLVAVDRYYAGTRRTLHLPEPLPEPPPAYSLRATTVGSLSANEEASIRFIHSSVRWRSRFHADPNCDEAYARRRAERELDLVLSDAETRVMLGLRGHQIVAYWITPIERDLSLAARHAQGANVDEGSGIATCVFLWQHRFLLQEAKWIVHPTQEDNRRIARVIESLGYDILCRRYNFHRWST